MPTNNTPILNSTPSPALASVIEDAQVPVNGSTAGGTLVSALVDAGGGLDNFMDADGDLPGIAITGVDDHGTVYYSTDAGTHWGIVTAASENNALALMANADTWLYFQPDADYNGTLSDALTFRAWDQTGGYANGQEHVDVAQGGSAFSLGSDTASVAVSSVNDAPRVVAPNANQVATENHEFSYTWQTSTFDEIDAGDGLVYSVTLADGSALPEWLSYDTGTRTFTGTPSSQQEGTLNIRITATDLPGASVHDDFNLSVQLDPAITHGDSADNLLVAPYRNTSQTLDGRMGNDTMMGNGGSDTYLFYRGAGQDTLVDYDSVAGNVDSLRMLDGLTVADLVFWRDQYHLYVGINGTSDQITLVNHYYNQGLYQIEQVEFEDASHLDLTHFNADFVGTSAADNFVGTGENNVMSGLGGNDHLNGEGGNDTLAGGSGNDSLYGGLGDDVYVFNLGDGQDTIFDEEGLNSLNFGAGISTDDLTLTRDDEDVVISIDGSSDGVTLHYGYNSTHFEITFDDGTVWDNLDIGTVVAGQAVGSTPAGISTVITYGTATADLLWGGNINESFDAGAGNDTVYGNSGNDTYLLHTGSGQDTIIDYDPTPGNEDTIHIGTGFSADDVLLWRDGDNLCIGLSGSTDQITVINQYFRDIYQVERLLFADGGEYAFSTLPVTTTPTPVTQLHNAGPSLATPLAANYTDTSADDSFASNSGTLLGTDLNGDLLIYGVLGGVDNGNGTFSKVGVYGTLTVESSTGNYTFAPNDAALEGLKVAASESFTVTVTDGVSTANANFVVGVSAANDPTVFSGDTAGSVTENTATVATGTLYASDRDHGDATLIGQTGVAGVYGTFNINTSGVWTYTLNNAATNVQVLNAGETATDTFTVTTAGGVTQTIAIAINGADNTDPTLDTPDEAYYVDTSGDDAFATHSGTLVGADVDGDALVYGIVGSHDNGDGTVSKTGGYGTLTVNASTGGYSFAPNDTAIEALKTLASESFTVSVNDGVATATASYTVNLAGTNDVAMLGGEITGTASEDSVLATQGSLTVADRDAGDNQVMVQSGSAATYGSFSIDASGVWTYQLNQAAANVQALAEGATVIDTFVVTSADSSSTVAVSVTVQGHNDAPIVAHTIADQTAYKGGAFSFQVPADSFTDIDTGDVLTLSATLADGGTLPAWLSFDTSTQTFSGTPGVLNVGTLSVRVTATDTQGLSVSADFALETMLTTVLTGTVGADTISFPDHDNNYAVSTYAGNDAITTGTGDDLVRAGEGSDTVETGAGNDVIVVVGRTAANQYSASDITNPGGSGIDLSHVLSLGDLNGRVNSEISAGESIDGGTGNDRLVIYGDVDLTGTTLSQIEQIQVNSTLAVSAQQINALGLSAVTGDGSSILHITNSGATPVVLDLSGVSLTHFYIIQIDAGVTAIVDQADIDSLTLMTGNGTLQASNASGTLDLTGKYVSLDVLDSTGLADANHGGGVYVSGGLHTGTDDADSVYGQSTSEIFDLGAGNDTIEGSGGNDIYLFKHGSGQDTIIDYDPVSGNSDTILLGSDLTTNNVTLWGDDYNLYVGIEGVTDQLTVVNNYYNNGIYQIEKIQFSDGSQYDLTALDLPTSAASLADILSGTVPAAGIPTNTGSSGDDNIYGASTAEIFDTGAGNDFLAGNAGDDVYVFNMGYGHDSVVDYDPTSGNVDTIRLGTGLNTGNVTLSADANNLYIGLTGSGDTLTVINQFYNHGLYEVEQLQFADGTIVDLSGLSLSDTTTTVLDLI